VNYKPEGLAETIFKERYTIHPDETWEEASKRLAKHVSSAEVNGDKPIAEEKFYEEIVTNRFMPGGRIWYGSGRPRAQLLNCFVVPTRDSREGWGTTIHDVIVISGMGGGVGINCCMAPSTLVLTQDLNWVRLSQLKIGDKLVGLDEQHEGAGRHLRPAEVLAAEPVRLPSYKIKTEKGEMTVSSVHPLLARKIKKSYKKIGEGFNWVEAQNLTDEYEIAFAADPWYGGIYNALDQLWMGGILDGEGCLSAPKATSTRKYNTVLSVGQNQGPVFDRIGKILDDTDIKYTIHKNQNSNCYQYRMATKWDSMKALRAFPTTRLWPKRDTVWEGAKIYGKYSNAVKVQSIEFIGEADLIALETSTKTFIGDGFYQHNSPIRPRGSRISGTGGIATGAVSLMHMINAVGDVLVGGGGRRLALMLDLNITHPDMPEFLDAKLDRAELTNANVSIIVDKKLPSETLVRKVRKGENFDLMWGGSPVRKVNAKEIWEKIVTNAWTSGEPGILNGDLANKESNIWYYKPLISTNPCGEIWLEEYGSCDLGALVLPRFVTDGGAVDWDGLRSTITTAVRFLDNVLSINEYPLNAIRDNNQHVRRLGLGIMGLHSMLIKMGRRYSQSNDFIDELMVFIKEAAYNASIDLAVEKGTFGAYDERFLDSGFSRRSLSTSIRSRIRKNGIRNAAILTIAPTGTTGMVSNVSTGIEPLFAPAYWRRFYRPTPDGSRQIDKELVIDPLWDTVADPSVLEGAYDIAPEAHFDVQRICQKHIDNAVSKTINLPENYPVESLSDLWLEYLPDLKGTTFYRAGSRGEEPLQAIPLEEAKTLYREHQHHSAATIEEQSSMDCPDGSCDVRIIPTDIPVEERALVFV